jgi:glutamate synthase (NADPH) small chain
MADPRGFLEHDREVAGRRPVEERIHDWQEVYPGGPGRALLPIIATQASRCMDCGIPFCHQGCPLGNLIPEWNDLVHRDDWDGAMDRLHATNNFPELTGRLCPAPCETACVLGINPEFTSGPVTIKNVEVAIIDRAWDTGYVRPRPPEWLSGRTVAVVGSGPAGLAAAQQLTRAGHTVAVYERAEKPGGLLRFGIPEFKLEKAVLDRRLDQMRREGTVFRSGVEVGAAGSELTGERLRERYDAVVLAIGSTVGRDLPLPGRELDGIHQAMEYLPQSNRASLGQDPVPPEKGEQITATGKDVVIIGGGDTGADCLGTATRQGARTITQLEILAQPPVDRPDHQPWPTYPMTFRVSSAHEESGDRVYAVSTQQFLGDGSAGSGRREGVRALRLVEVDASFQPLAGSEREIPGQLVLLAMGFTGPQREGLVDQLGVDLDERGNVARDAAYTSSVEGVFVAGDAGRGQSLIVWAIAEGRAAAAAVDRYLTGETSLPSPIPPTARPLVV